MPHWRYTMFLSAVLQHRFRSTRSQPNGFNVIPHLTHVKLRPAGARAVSSKSDLRQGRQSAAPRVFSGLWTAARNPVPHLTRDGPRPTLLRASASLRQRLNERFSTVAQMRGQQNRALTGRRYRTHEAGSVKVPPDLLDANKWNCIAV